MRSISIHCNDEEVGTRLCRWTLQLFLWRRRQNTKLVLPNMAGLVNQYNDLKERLTFQAPTELKILSLIGMQAICKTFLSRKKNVRWSKHSRTLFDHQVCVKVGRKCRLNEVASLSWVTEFECVQKSMKIWLCAWMRVWEVKDTSLFWMMYGINTWQYIYKLMHSHLEERDWILIFEIKEMGAESCLQLGCNRLMNVTLGFRMK